MTRPGKTPDEPGDRCQADGPQVLPERAKDEDMRELQDPYDLLFPTTPIAGRPAVPSTRSSSISSAAGSQADHPH